MEASLGEGSAHVEVSHTILNSQNIPSRLAFGAENHAVISKS